MKVDVLDPRKQHDLAEQTKPRLLEGTVWHLDDERELTGSVVAWPRPRRKGERGGSFVSSHGAYGQYVKRTLESYPAPEQFRAQSVRRAETGEVIRFLFLALKRYGIVEQVRSGRDGGDPGYQLNADALRWLPGDGEGRPLDRTRLLEEGGLPAEVNHYFVECYRRFVDLRSVLEAREHTAQVMPEDRQEREERFRAGTLLLLFCSPTMELGVDVAQLNLVNLRNVPPTPANYAQRSGRAGRGGQPALVFTYCAGRSPHDRYFYREPAQTVAGAVAPPRIDLRNRDLVRSHVHAIWMEGARPDLGRTLTTVLDLDPANGTLPLPVKRALTDELRSPVHRVAARARAEAVIAEIRPELERTAWFHAGWVDEALDRIERSFDAACERWRSLYRAAIRQRELHHRIIGDHSRPEAERNHSARLRAQAESQIRLLTEAEGIYEGDFYSWRYFATEGFLPGYNFPRLPISAYVPGRRRRRGRDEFISRPRFLAVSEFGPRALIYHEGARYRVSRVNLDFGSDAIEDTHRLPTDTMKRCERCGEAHLQAGEAHLAEVCDRCGEALDTPSRIDHLVRMQNVSLRHAQRITCDEEERQRFGYHLVTAYRFPEVNGRPDRKDAEVRLPRRNLVSALVAFENSDSAAGLSEVAEALSVWLRDSGEDELRRAFVEWLRRVLPRRLGEGAPPVVQALEGGGAMLAERAKEWTEQWLQEGLERGRAEERALPCRQAGRKFDAETAERLSGLLERLSNPERLAEVGDWIIECRTGAELLDHAGRISRLS